MFSFAPFSGLFRSAKTALEMPKKKRREEKRGREKREKRSKEAKREQRERERDLRILERFFLTRIEFEEDQ